MSAREYKRQYFTEHLRTETQQQKDPYPGHFEFRCVHEIDDLQNLSRTDVLQLWEAENYPGNPCRVIRSANQPRGKVYKVLYKEQARNYIEDSSFGVHRRKRLD